jgi:hypothetical protein
MYGGLVLWDIVNANFQHSISHSFQKGTTK